MKCYYDNELCEGDSWKCETCCEHFCQTHWHETDKGHCVECVSCERERKDNQRSIDTFTAAYIEAALWSSTDDEGNSLVAGVAELSEECKGRMIADCFDFQAFNGELLQSAYDSESVAYDESRAGHDFWLTRCGHGAGFWDRDLGDIGEKLSDKARGFGDAHLYIGDDGLIYGM